MKKILSILAFVMAVTFTSNAQSPQSLESVTKSLSSKCPNEISEGLVLSNVTLTDSAVVFEYNISDELFANIKDLGGILHDSLLAEMQSSPETNIQSLLASCKSTKMHIIERFKDSEGQIFDIVILPEEL